MAERMALLDLSLEELAERLAEWGEPRFRAEQIWGWVYGALVDRAEGMTNLPAGLRARLAAEAIVDPLRALAEERSRDGRTLKVLFGLGDGATIESVLMGYDRRQTACISVQAGCAMGCTFCATGQGGLQRDLTAGEIVAQVLHLARAVRSRGAAGRPARGAGEELTNVVFMGMGEPLANYAATWKAVELLTDARGLGMGARRITLSTVGLVPGIVRLAGERLPVNLAVSLHAPDDELRSRLVPANRRYPLGELLEAVRGYTAATHRRVSFEYALIEGVNDSPEQARRLAGLLRGMLCHVNLIPLNPTPGAAMQPSPRERVEAFRVELAEAGVPVTVRMRRGIEIRAGCGQLRERQRRGR